MNTNTPILTEASIDGLTDKQIVEWYRFHGNATVRALVRRIRIILERQQGALTNAYQDGFYAGIDHSNPYRLSPEEIRLASVHVD